MTQIRASQPQPGLREAASHRPPTLETVAALAGVSRATVSRVINNASNVSAEIRAAVEVAIERVGYVPNRAARSLVTRRTNSIALVVREAIDFGFADPYLASIVVAASQSLAGSDVQLAVMMASNDEDHAKLARYVQVAHVDGVILISVHDDDRLPLALLRAGVPMVVGGRPPIPLPGACYVDADNPAGAALAAEHLLATGRRRLAMISGPADMTASIDRLDGFRAALRAAGQPPPAVEYGNFTRESGEAAMTELLRRDPDLDGIFAANDLMAIGGLRALRNAGRDVPGQVAVIGFDDVELSKHTEPPLTTIDQAIAQQARTMVELLLAQIDGHPDVGPHILPTRLVRRGTS